jgi:hypothetical protein
MPVLSVSKEALSAIRDRLVASGYRKRTGEIYTRPLDGDVLGWIGMQHAGRPGGAVAIAPTVGVRHPAVERLVYAFHALQGRPAEAVAALGPLFVQVENWSTGRAESLRFLENFSAYFDIPTVE